MLWAVFVVVPQVLVGVGSGNKADWGSLWSWVQQEAKATIVMKELSPKKKELAGKAMKEEKGLDSRN